MPLYKLRREPSKLNDIDWDKYLHKPGISIWHGNETINTCSKRYDEEKCFVFTLNDDVYERKFMIYGQTDAAIAETAVFFWSLKHSEEVEPFLHIYGCVANFDFAAIQPEQLAQALDANPKRSVEISKGMMTAAQTVILATRPYPLDLTLHFMSEGFNLEDGDTAFVNALETRTTSFGSLTCNSYYRQQLPMTRENLIRRFQLDETLDKLGLSFLDGGLALLPFSAKVHELDYEIDGEHMQGTIADSLGIVTKNLNLTIFLDRVREWDDLLLSFLKRVADLGHFERLSFGVALYDGDIDWSMPDFSTVAPLADALIRVINENQNLIYSDLSETHHMIDWTSHLKNIFKALEEHKGLKIFRGGEYPPDSDQELDEVMCDPDYSALKQLLSRNRDIMVINPSDDVRTDGSSIDALYLLNHFCLGSANLVKETVLPRQLLMSTALTESASQNYQYSALLLANYTDVLSELIQGLNLDEQVNENHHLYSIDR